jgi:hypothetical protein
MLSTTRPLGNKSADLDVLADTINAEHQSVRTGIQHAIRVGEAVIAAKPPGWAENYKREIDRHEAAAELGEVESGSTIPSWQLITSPCPRCGTISTCWLCGSTIGCRWESGQGEQGRVHVGRTPPNTATYALFNISNSTPAFPGAIPEFTWMRGVD